MHMQVLTRKMTLVVASYVLSLSLLYFYMKVYYALTLPGLL